jgi:acetyltransferase-like isoleucine patch superfamily enzyme
MHTLRHKAQVLASLVRGLRDLVVVYLPGPAGGSLRVRYYKKRFRFLGKNVLIDVGAHFVNPEYMSIGDNCWIDKYVVLMAGPPVEGKRKIARRANADFHHREGDLVVGRNCHIASHVVINAHGGVSIGENSTVAAGAKVVSLSHHYRNLADPSDQFRYRFGSRAPEAEQALISSPVVIGENAALATNAVMLPGSSIGRDSWVGAGSLVRDAIQAGCIAWGTPAKPVKTRPGARALAPESANYQER